MTRLSNVQLSPDGRLVAAIGLDATHQTMQPAVRILVWELATGALLQNWLEPRELNRLLFSNDGQRLAAFVCHSTLRMVNQQRDVATVFDTATGERRGLVRHDDDIDTVHFLPDTEHLLLTTLGWSGRNRKELYRWRIASETLARLGSELMPDHLTAMVSPDGKQLAVGSHTVPFIRLIDTATGVVTRTLQSEASNITSLTFTADGQRLVACGTTGVVLAWDLDDDDDSFRLRANPLPPGFLVRAFSADQSRFAAANSFLPRRFYAKWREVSGGYAASSSGHVWWYSWTARLRSWRPVVVRRQRLVCGIFATRWRT